MITTITEVRALDIRFPTSRGKHGSDAMHQDPDYSAAYVILSTDHADGLEGHGLTFTIGRGNPLALIAGPCVIESEELVLSTCEKIREITSRQKVPFVFKSSYTKANRLKISRD